MEPTNEMRCAWARIALDAYGLHTGQSGEDYQVEPEAIAEAIGDLIADLLHLAKEHGLDTSELIEVAEMHFFAEVNEEAA